jgi:hypothetical protein
LAGLIGIHYGFDKGLGVSDEALKEIENEVDDKNKDIWFYYFKS